jgi:hypothetical protein
MHYPIQSDLTTNGYSVDLNCKLSALDSQLASMAYPGPLLQDRLPEALCCDPNIPFEGYGHFLESAGCALGVAGTYSVIGVTGVVTTLLVAGSMVWIVKKCVRKRVPSLSRPIEDIEAHVEEVDLEQDQGA